MSDNHRRRSVYADEAPLSLDAPPPRRGGGPAPVSLLLSLLLLVAVVGGVVYLYRDGVRGADGPPRPVGAPVSDVRTAAPPKPQAADPAAGLSIYKDDAGPDAAPAFAPPPEQPRERTPAATPALLSNQAVSEPPAVAPPTADAKPPPAAKAAIGKAPTIDGLISAAEKPRPATPAAGGAVVQIGAFSTEALANQAWSQAARTAPGAMAGKNRRVAAITKDGAMLWRAAITGFVSHEEAQALCGKLQAAGQACFVR